VGLCGAVCFPAPPFFISAVITMSLKRHFNGVFMLFKIYLNGGYIATGEYKSEYEARKAFANLFKIHVRNFTAEEKKDVRQQSV
jgi:hypothetical protein